MPKNLQAFAGALVAAVIDIFINLIAAGAQKREFIDQLISSQGIWILVVLVFIGLLVGVLLGKFADSSPQSTTSNIPDGIIVSRTKLFWSTTHLKGKGIRMDNVTSIGSENEADTTS